MSTAKEAKPADEERQAIARLQRGDIGGLEVLVQRYQVEALRTAYLICRNRALAEDVAQATFLHLYEKIAQFDTSRSFGPWLLKSIVNNTLQAMRQQGRTTSIGDEWLEQEDGTRGESSAGYLPSLEDKLDQLDTNEALTTALTQLPPEQRAAVVMSYYLGFSMEEISEKLNCTTGTVRWRLFRGRERLRHLLELFWRDMRREHSAGTRTDAPFVSASHTLDGRSKTETPTQS